MGLQELPPGGTAGLAATDLTTWNVPGAETFQSKGAEEGATLLPSVVRKAFAREVISELGPGT